MTAESTPASVITELRPLPTRPSIRSVRVDGKVVARLSESDIAALDLRVGRTWTSQLEDAVRVATEVARARQDALRYLGGRALTRRELADRLARREHASDAVGPALDELAEQGWIDDEGCATYVIDRALARKPASRAGLLAKLEARGIAGDLATRVVDEALRDIDPVEAATALARRRMRTAAAGGTPSQARRIAGDLSRQGFDADVVGTVLDRLGLIDPHG